MIRVIRCSSASSRAEVDSRGVFPHLYAYVYGK